MGWDPNGATEIFSISISFLEAQNCQEDSFWAGQEGQRPHKLPANALYINVIITVVGIIKQSFKPHRIS